MKEEQKTKRGGKRPGAGRPKINGGTFTVHLTLDGDTLAVMHQIGGGNVSAGVRAAARIVSEGKTKPPAS